MIRTGNSVLLRERCYRESQIKGVKEDRYPRYPFPDVIWFLACLIGYAPIKTMKLRFKSNLAITTEIRGTHKPRNRLHKKLE